MRPTLEELSQALALIHEAAASPGGWTGALAALTDLCESSKGAVLEIDAAGRFAGFTQIGHDPAAQKEYAEHYHAIDPTLKLIVASLPHEGLSVYEHFPTTVRSRDEYFAYMQSYDTGDVIATRTRGGPAGHSVLSLQRPLRAPAFGEDTERLLRLVVPHLEIAKRVQARVAEAIASRDALAAGLDRLADAAFILDATRAIRFLNTAARRLLAADARLRSFGGKLAFSASRLQSAFHAAVQDATAKTAQARLLALPGTGACAAEVTVCPLRAEHALAGAWQEPLVLVMVSVQRQDAASIADRMRQIHRLTPAEARVVAQLALGRSLQEISTRTGVRESTLRTQIKSIFAKVGVARQSDLVRVALSGAPLAPDRHT